MYRELAHVDNGVLEEKDCRVSKLIGLNLDVLQPFT